MSFNEGVVFKWVLIVGIAGASVIALALLTRPLVGALWGLVLVIAASSYGIRWGRGWWREARDRPGGPGHGA